MQVIVGKILSEEELEEIKKSFNASTKGVKTYMPIIIDEEPDVYQAFEAMHKADGTIKGRPVCSNAHWF